MHAVTENCTILSLDDLGLIVDPAQLNGTCYYELRSSEYILGQSSHLSEGSLYIPPEAFDFLFEYFARSKSLFDNFAPTRLDANEIELLLRHLKNYLLELYSDNWSQSLYDGFKPMMTTKAEWRSLDQSQIKMKLMVSVSTLITFIENKSLESGVLWLLGI